MSADELPFSAKTFTGIARLFPLPNVVLFPHVALPLHIFEPRYVQMLEESLAKDRLIAMALLVPGWEPDYDGRPAVHDVACLGRILSAQSVPDNRYNILLQGFQRIRLVHELPPAKAFREAQVELLTDQYPASTANTRTELQATLVRILQESLVSATGSTEQLSKILEAENALGTLTDLLAYRLELSVAVKQQLLAETNVDRRAACLLELMRNAPQESSRAAFPPQFSQN